MKIAEFDPQPTLHGERLHLSPLKAQDYDGLYDAARDPKIWAGHPAKDRYRPEVFKPYFDSQLESASTLVVRDKFVQKIIGCSRYYTPPQYPDDLSIGFTFLTTLYWGGSYNRELKTLMLSHAFKSKDAVLFHVAPVNIRSQKATLKLGAELIADETIDISDGPSPWRTYRLDRSSWKTFSTPA